MTHSRLMYLPLIVAIGFAAQDALDGEELRNLAPRGTFEEDVEGLGGWIPIGVVTESDSHGIRIVEGAAHSGKKALQIVPGPRGPVEGVVHFADYNGGEGNRQVTAQDGVRGARTFAMRLDPDITALEASLWIQGAKNSTFSFSAVWTTRQDRKPVVEIQRDTVNESNRNEEGWQHFEIQAERPSMAHQVQLWIETTGDSTLLIDDVHLRFTDRKSVV